MNQKNLPTFPTFERRPFEDQLTIRDEFAIRAMAAIITTSAEPVMFGLAGYDPNIAKSAYKMADAMLAERAK
jgi:hypothetical protein